MAAVCSWSAVLASIMGFACLALAMLKHHTLVSGDANLTVAKVRLRRTLGFCLLALSLGLSLAGNGASFGSIFWVLALSLSAMTVAFALTWKPTALQLITRFL